jgi:hypothetical protein
MRDEQSEKFLKLRDGIWEHLSPEGLQPTEFIVYLRIMSLANIRTGQLRITVVQLAAELYGTFRPNSVKKTLISLERKGYIHRRVEKLSTGMLVIIVNKFEIAIGSKAGQRVEIPKTEAQEGVMDSTGGVTISTTYPDRPCSLARHNPVDRAHEHDISQCRMFSDNESNELQTTRYRKEEDKEQDGKSLPVSYSSNPKTEQSSIEEPERGAGPEPHIPERNGEAETNPVHQHTPAAPVQQPKGKAPGIIIPRLGPAPKKLVQSAAASVPSAAMILAPSAIERMHPPRVTAGNWDAVDYAFVNQQEIAGYSPKEIRRIVWYHWRVAGKKYWSKSEANVNSPARFEAVLAKMAEQVPEFFRLTGEVTCPIPVADPSCTVCSGDGNTTSDHRSYPSGWYQESLQCACVRPHPYPWRLVKAGEAA